MNHLSQVQKHFTLNVINGLKKVNINEWQTCHDAKYDLSYLLFAFLRAAILCRDTIRPHSAQSNPVLPLPLTYSPPLPSRPPPFSMFINWYKKIILIAFLDD
jgi:hypothetical protein